MKLKVASPRRRVPRVEAVFINCPFDSSYQRIFDAIVFAVMALGFEPRCARERDTGTQERLRKIQELIDACHYGLHDISFMSIDRRTRLPRYNMAFELGLFIGCYEFGGPRHARKSCLILDRQSWRYRKSFSDLSGRDIKAHRGKPKQAIIAVRDWLVTESGMEQGRGGSFIFDKYRRFRQQLPALCRRAGRRIRELSFKDYCEMVAFWLKTNA